MKCSLLEVKWECYGSLHNYIIPHVTDLQSQRVRRVNCLSLSVPSSIVCVVHVTAHRRKRSFCQCDLVPVSSKCGTCYALGHIDQGCN